MEIITNNEMETENFAKEFAQTLRGGEIILLSGDLGAGKTVFTRGIAKGLGITEAITSPTFTIMNFYEGDIDLYHVDAYRLKNGEEAYEAGITEFIGEKECVFCIEWWQNVEEAICGKKIKVEISYLEDEKRKITINEQ